MRALFAALLVVLVLAGACGDPYDFANDGTGLDASTDAEPAEEPATSFPCGQASCIVGQHVCCAVSQGFACLTIGAGCPSPGDAGTDADAQSAPQLKCATYNNCSGGDDCCYRPGEGSSCMPTCPSGYSKLCRLGQDNCGSFLNCLSMPMPPLPNAGECR